MLGIAWDLYDVFSQDAGENRILRESEKMVKIGTENREPRAFGCPMKCPVQGAQKT